MLRSTRVLPRGVAVEKESHPRQEAEDDRRAGNLRSPAIADHDIGLCRPQLTHQPSQSTNRGRTRRWCQPLVAVEQVSVPGHRSAKTGIVKTLGYRPVVHLQLDGRLSREKLQTTSELLRWVVHDEGRPDRFPCHSSLATARDA